MNLNFLQLPYHRPDCDKLLFGDPLPEHQLQSQPMSEDDRDYFGRMVDPSLILAPLGETEERTRGLESVSPVA